MVENHAYKTDSGCWTYDNNEKNVAIDGRLNNWETAKIICPSGWHLPPDEEWKQLEMAIGMSQPEVDEYGLDRVTDEGVKLNS